MTLSNKFWAIVFALIAVVLLYPIWLTFNEYKITGDLIGLLGFGLFFVLSILAMVMNIIGDRLAELVYGEFSNRNQR